MGYSTGFRLGSGDEDELQQDRRIRRVPPAITPVRVSDIAAGMVGQHRGSGRDAFRERIREFLGGDSAGTYTSFRRALAACLQRLSAQRDCSTVAVPAFCSSDYRAAIEGVGLEKQRYDVDSDSLAADLDSIRALSLDDTLVLVVVNVLGYGSAMDEIAQFCADHDVYLLEALGYGLGASYEGARLGTYGDCSVLNFQQGKPIPVGGGMVVSRNPSVQFDDNRRPVATNAVTLTGYKLFSHPRAYFVYSRLLQRVVDALGRSVDTHPEPKEVDGYDRPAKTISDFQGTVGQRVFQRLDQHRRERALTAQYYARELDDVDGIRLLEPLDGLERHQWVRYPVMVESSRRREAIQSALSRAGIEARMLYDWPILDANTYPGAARLQQEILTLPTHPYVDHADRKRTVEIIESVARPDHSQESAATAR